MKFQSQGGRRRAGISPFLATVILVVITLMIGGILYTTFRQMVVSEVKDPSVTLLDTNVSPDGETMTLDIKNDGNVPVTLLSIDVSYGAATNVFKEGGAGANVTVVSTSSGSATMQPGDSAHRGGQDELPGAGVRDVHGDGGRGPGRQGVQHTGLSGEMKSRAAIAQYEATIVLVVISLSLASVVYAGLRRESSVDPQPLFVNEETPIGGSPAIERVEVNSSSATTVYSLSLDDASSASGVLAFDGSAYSTIKSLCAAGVTTFFSVLATQAGTLGVATNGSAMGVGDLGSRGERHLGMAGSDDTRRDDVHGHPPRRAGGPRAVEPLFGARLLHPGRGRPHRHGLHGLSPQRRGRAQSPDHGDRRVRRRLGLSEGGRA